MNIIDIAKALKNKDNQEDNEGKSNHLDDAILDNNSLEKEIKCCYKPVKILEEYVLPNFNIGTWNSKAKGSETTFKRRLSQILCFIDIVKYVRSSEKCSVLALSTTSKHFIKIFHNKMGVSRAFEYLIEIGLMEVEEAKYQYNAYYEYDNKCKTYRYYVENEKKFLEYCKKNNIQRAVIKNGSELKESERIKITNILEKRTQGFSKEDVKFSPHLKLYKIEGMGRGLFEKYLYECLKENYPELKSYQDLANEINEKYYSDKYGDFAISFEPSFTWDSKGTKVTKIGIRACNSLASNPKERSNKNIHKILRQEIRDKYGLNLEKDVKSSVPRVTYGLTVGGWVVDEVDLYKKIYEKYDPNGEFNDEYRQAIKDLFFRVYFDDSNEMLGKNIWFKISKSGLNKEDVYKEVIKLREATLEALGGVDYSSEIFFAESCIYMDVLKILLDKGFLVWQVYDCFYAKGLGTQEEFEEYVKEAVYLSFVSYKFKKDYYL